MSNVRQWAKKDSPIAKAYFQNGGKGTLTGAGTIRLPKEDKKNGNQH